MSMMNRWMTFVTAIALTWGCGQKSSNKEESETPQPVPPPSAPPTTPDEPGDSGTSTPGVSPLEPGVPALPAFFGLDELAPPLDAVPITERQLPLELGAVEFLHYDVGYPLIAPMLVAPDDDESCLVISDINSVAEDKKLTIEREVNHAHCAVDGDREGLENVTFKVHATITCSEGGLAAYHGRPISEFQLNIFTELCSEGDGSILSVVMQSFTDNRIKTSTAITRATLSESGAPCRFSTKGGKRTFADDCTILRKVAIGSEDGNYKMFSRANLKGVEGDLVSQKYNSGTMEMYFQDWRGQISLQPDSPPQFEMRKGEHSETGVVAMEEFWQPNTDIPR